MCCHLLLFRNNDLCDVKNSVVFWSAKMYNIETEHQVLCMMENLVEQQYVNTAVVDFIVQNEEKIFSVLNMVECKPKFVTLFWRIAKADGTGQLRSLGIGYDILPLMPGTCYTKAVGQALKLGSIRLGKGLWKVIFMFFCLFGITSSNNTLLEVVNSGKNLIIRNQVPSAQLAEVTEIFSLAPLYVFINQVENAIEEVGFLNRYELSKTGCLENEQPDDILSVVKIAKRDQMSMVRMNSVEEYKGVEYETVLFSSNFKSFYCLVTFSSSFQEKLMNRNPFRVLPSSHMELENYREHMKDYFSDDLGNTCVKNGMLYDYKKYRVSFKVQQPGIERCAVGCHAQSNMFKLRHEMTKLGLGNNSPCIPVDIAHGVRCINYLSSTRPCVAWSFNLKDQTCFYHINMSDDELHNGLYEYYDQKAAITAKSGCLPTASKNPVFINIGNKTVNAKNICLFSPESFSDLPLLTRCPNNFFEVQRPLNSLFEEVSYFKANFMNLYSKFEKRNKRSIGTLVFDVLKNAALHQGKTILRTLINGIGKNENDLLNSAKIKLEKSGFNTLIGSESKISVELFNYSQMSIYFDKLNELSKTYKINEMKGLIHNLESEFFRLKTYLSRLMTNSSPLLKSTVKEIQKSEYIFTSYLFEKDIVRHFFISEQLSKFKATSLSVIPIDLINFQNLEHYQTGIFTMHEKSDLCLMDILNGKNTSDLIENKICHKNSAVISVNQNLIIMNHTYNSETIKIFSIRNEAFIEIYCPLKSHIWTSKSLIIIAVPEVCSISINKQKVQEKTMKKSEFSPLILYKMKDVNAPPLSNILDDYWILWFILMGLATFGLIMTAICFAKNQKLLPIKSYYKINQPEFELDVQDTQIFEPKEVKRTLKRI